VAYVDIKKLQAHQRLGASPQSKLVNSARTTLKP